MTKRLATLLGGLLLGLACVPSAAQPGKGDPTKDRDRPPLLMRSPALSKDHIAFGPWMLVGALLALLVEIRPLL